MAYSEEANVAMSHAAQRGQMGMTHGAQMPGPFTVSNGMYTSGKDHASKFAAVVNMSGGVRQGKQFTSDPASGVGRAPVAENHTHLDMQSQGAGTTFRARQHRRWRGAGG